MKGLPSACCCCSKPLNNDSVLLVCSCLVSICRSCCLEQMANKPSTYRSHITCPVCGDQQTNVVNGIIGGIKEAENDEEELISDACDYFGVPILRARKSLKTKLNMLRTLQGNFASLGYPWFIEPAESKPSEIVYRLGLYVSRCEARRQDPEEAAGTLPLGPLECITFKPNYILHRILDMVAGREDAIAMQKYCNICRDILVPGNTVRRMCPCRAHACQHCVRRSLTSNNTYNQPARCFSCNLGTILVEDVQEARRAEQELLRDLPQYKSGAGIARMYSLYTDLSQECGMIKTLDYDSFMGQDHTGKIYGRAMCTLELARLCQERRRRRLLNVPAGQASDVSELSLGPLAYLSIDCDVFLEAFLVFLDGPADPPDTTGQVLNDPRCCFDEATNRVRQTHQPGGELSREVAAEAEAERLRQDAAVDQTVLGRDLTLLLRSAHTPCPYEGCSVDPQCPVYLDEHIARYHIGSVVELATPVSTPASRRRSRRPSQAPLQEGAVVVIDDDSTGPGSEVAEWESCSTASTSAAAVAESIFSVVSNGDASEGALAGSIAISSEDEDSEEEGVEEDMVAEDSEDEAEEEQEAEGMVVEEEGGREVPRYGMQVAAVPPVVAVDRPRPGLVFRALQPSQSANMSLPAQPQRRSTLPVAGTTTPSAQRHSQSRWPAAAASLTLSVSTNTAATVPALATTIAPVHHIKRKVDTFVEDEVEAPAQVQQFLNAQAPRRALPQPLTAPPARAFTGRTLADAVTSAGAPPVVDLTSAGKAARIAEVNRKYQAQMEADERPAAPLSTSSKVRFTSGHETRTFEKQQHEEQEEEEEVQELHDEDTSLLPVPTDYSLSDFTEPLRQLQSAPELDFFSMVNRARSSIHLAARPPTPPPSPPPPPDPVPASHEQLSVCPPPPPHLPSANHWMSVEDGVHGMGHPSKRARLDASPPPYGTPYAEGQQRFLGKVMGTPEEAWPSDEAHRNLQDPRARRYELVFEQEAPLAAASSKVVEFRLKYPAGALKTSTEAVPSSEEGFFVVNIPIVHGVQSRLLAVLQLIVMQKYEFRGEISKWKLIRSNKIQNFLDATKTFLKYGIPAGSRIVLRELPPEVEPKPPAPFKQPKRGKKRMTNAQFAKESMLRKQQAEEEALRVQTEWAVKAESGLGADLPVKGESSFGTVRPVQAEPEEGEVPDDAAEDVTLVDSGSSNHSGDRTLSDDGVSESSSAVRCTKPTVATFTDASASRKRSRWVDAKPTDSRHVVSPPGTEEGSRRVSSSSGMTVVDPSLLLAASSLPPAAEQPERNVRPKLTKEALSSLQSGFDAATHPPVPLPPLQSSQLPVSGVGSTAQQTAALPVKSRFGTDEDFQVDSDDLETSSDDSDADPNPTGKRKGGMRKDKLPLAQRRTGSTNATGITNGNHRPPIYFDRSVTFNTTAAVDSHVGQSHVGQSQSGMRPVSDLAALRQTGRLEQSSGRDCATGDRRGHSNASSDDRNRSQHRYSSDQGGSRYEPRRDGRGRQRSPPRTAAGTDDMRSQYRGGGRDRDNSGRGRDSSGRGRDSSGRDRGINRENYSSDGDRDRDSYGRDRESVGWSIDRGSSAQYLMQPAQGRASAGQQLQGGSAATAIDLAASPSEAALQEVLSWQAKPHR